MKACPHCSTTYDDRVDFCFRDGTPLEVSVEPAVPSAADLPEEPPGADLPTPGLKPAVAGGALSIAGMLDVPEPGFAGGPRDSAKSAPVTRTPEPPESIPEEDLEAPEPLEAPAAAPLSEAVPEVAPEAAPPEVAPEPTSAEEPEEPEAPEEPVAAPPEAAPIDPVIEEDLAPPVAFTEDAGIDTDALPPLSEPEPPEEAVAAPEPVVAPAPEPEPVPEPPAAALPPYAEEPEEESSSRGGLMLLVGAVVLLVGVATVAVMQMSGADDSEPVATAPTEPEAPTGVVTPEPPPPLPVEDPVAEADPEVDPEADPAVDPEADPAEEPTAEDPTVAEPTVAEPVEDPTPDPVEPPPVEEPPAPDPTPDPVEADSPWGQPTEEPAATAELDPGAENMWGSEEDDAKQGTLNIASNPAGAIVWLGTKRLGSAPINTTVDFGTYTIKVEMDGYRTEIRSVDMQSSELAVPFELKPIIDKGTVHIYGKTGHLIYINGEPVGPSPINTTLAPGRHTVRIVAEDGTSSRITVEVAFEDATTPFIIDLSN